MNTTHEVAVLGQSIGPEPQWTAQACSTITRPVTDGTVRPARSDHHRARRMMRHLLHAFLQAGQPAGPEGVRPLLGPNGAVLWTATRGQVQHGRQGWDR
jgi:hypothetical protein